MANCRSPSGPLREVEDHARSAVAYGRIGRWLLAIAVALPLAAQAQETPDEHDIVVSVRRDAQAVVIDGNWLVDAAPQDAWDVLTDYDHMAAFVSSLAASHIVARSGGKLEVEQTSHFGIGPFRYQFDTVRDVELIAQREIRSTLIRGDMKASTFTTRLVPDGGETRVFVHGRFIPDRWIPPLIGTAMLGSETRKQFAELRAEILRRTRRATPGGSASG
jgi:carbon monoxide dehydrogenase subunit G